MSMNAFKEQTGGKMLSIFQELFTRQMPRYEVNSARQGELGEFIELEILPVHCKETLDGIINNGIPIFRDSNNPDRLKDFQQRWDEATKGEAPFEKYYNVYSMKEQAMVFNNEFGITEEIMSFKEWQKGDKKLAFFYNGIFWFYQENEDLNACVQRFFRYHPALHSLARKEMKKFGWKRKKGITDGLTRSLFEDGAIFFFDTVLVRKLTEEYWEEDNLIEEYLDFPSYVWLLTAFKGYFPKITEICLIKDYDDMKVFRKK